jgi:signal peptidase II
VVLEVVLKKYIKDYAFLLGFAVVIIGLDQWTKWLVRTRLALGDAWSPWAWLAPYARIVHWNNTGAAFGLFQGYNAVFSVLAIAVSLAILYYFPTIPARDIIMRITLALMFCGATGNLIDRLTVGRVTDFISVGSFAVFNIADSCITVGVVILLLVVFYRDMTERKTAQKALTASAVEASSSTDADGQKSETPQ